MKIVIPLPEKISLNNYINGTRHWAKKNATARLYHEAFWEFKNKFEIKKYPIAISFVFRFKGRLLDIDNLGISEKLCIDGLRHIGLLKDDTPKYINELHTYIEKGERDEIEITFYNLSEGCWLTSKRFT